MKIINVLSDDQFEDHGFNHIRKCARAVTINHQKQVALTKLHGHDIFGSRNYYELPGGGVNEGEDILAAARREMGEELGAETQLIAEIGEVDDFYNLIKRKNINYYFLLQVTSFHEKHWEVGESRLLEKIVWVDIEEAINLMESNPDSEVGKLVKARELPILKLARELIKTLII